MKNMMRCIIKDLQYGLPKRSSGNLVHYYSRRKNIHKTKVLNNNIAPRVRLISCQLEYPIAFKAWFGVFVETQDPEIRSNLMEEQSKPCIAL